MIDEDTTEEAQESTDPLESVIIEDGNEDVDSDVVNEEVTDTPDDQETETSKPINQEAVNKKINKISFKRYEAERKQREAEERLNEANKRIAELEGKDKDIVIPEIPDSFDADYEEKIAQRDLAIRKQAELVARRTFLENQQKEAALKAQSNAQKEVNDLVDSMYSKSDSLGIKETELKEYDNIVGSHVNTVQGLPKFILSLENSPLVVKYLATTPDALSKVSHMDPLSAASYISTVIVPEANKFKPGIPSTPNPIDIPRGKGAGQQKSKYLDGVSFE